MRKPVVVLDIALAAEAWRRPEYARGVHRVAGETLSRLLHSSEFELRLIATSNLASAYEMLGEKGSLRALFYRPTHLWLGRWADKAFSWIARTLPNRRFSMRALRWVLQRLSKVGDRLARHLPISALEGADIYHSPLAPIPKIVQRRNRIRKFLTIHDVIPLSNPEIVRGKGMPLLSAQLNSLNYENSFAFCVSKSVKGQVTAIGALPADRIFVTPLAASPEIFHRVTDGSKIEATLAAREIPNRPYFLALSSIDPRKNFDHVIRCFARLISLGKLQECQLLIVGANPERNTYLDSTLEHFPSEKEHIKVVGHIPDEELAAIYSGALAFLFPSLGEGFGIPVLEAMQCGTPVVCSNAPALPEVLGDAGILLDPRDMDAWCEVMARIASDAGLREALTFRGLERAPAFSWDRFIDATAQGYRVALESRRIHCAKL